MPDNDANVQTTLDLLNEGLQILTNIKQGGYDPSGEGTVNTFLRKAEEFKAQNAPATPPPAPATPPPAPATTPADEPVAPAPPEDAPTRGSL